MTWRVDGDYSYLPYFSLKYRKNALSLETLLIFVPWLTQDSQQSQIDWQKHVSSWRVSQHSAAYCWPNILELLNVSQKQQRTLLPVSVISLSYPDTVGLEVQRFEYGGCGGLFTLNSNFAHWCRSPGDIIYSQAGKKKKLPMNLPMRRWTLFAEKWYSCS